MVMTSIARYPGKAYAGTALRIDERGADSVLNHRRNVAAVRTIVITAANAFLYTVSVNGVIISFTSDGSATVAEVRDGLAAAALASPFFDALATLVASGSDLVLTERLPANGPLTVALSANLAATVNTAHQNETYWPAGVMAAHDAALVVTDGPLGGKLPDASGDQFLGITILEPQYVDPTRTDRGAIPPYRTASVLKRGSIMVRVENAVTPADVPAVRITASGANTQLGAIRTGTDSGNAVALTGLARFKHSAGAGELVEMSINLP